MLRNNIRSFLCNFIQTRILIARTVLKKWATLLWLIMSFQIRNKKTSMIKVALLLRNSIQNARDLITRTIMRMSLNKNNLGWFLCMIIKRWIVMNSLVDFGTSLYSKIALWITDQWTWVSLAKDLSNILEDLIGLHLLCLFSQTKSIFLKLFEKKPLLLRDLIRLCTAWLRSLSIIFPMINSYSLIRLEKIELRYF